MLRGNMDEQRYGALLADVRPRIIETAEEHERLLGLAEESWSEEKNSLKKRRNCWL